MYDYLIVGAGFAGSVLAERLARVDNRRVLVVDRRSHIGGNAYDHRDAAGVLVHKYGPHIFHTNSEHVFTYLSQFTTWRKYEHRVLSHVDGRNFPFPINVDTVNQYYDLKMDAFQMTAFLRKLVEHRDLIRTSEDYVVSKVGRELYEKFFRNYTRKQWGLDPSELDASVAARIPVRPDRDDRYFNDTIQAMPSYGYTRMFERMLNHENIDVVLDTDYRSVASTVKHGALIYTGAIDEYFDCVYGKLPYRSLEFAHETHDCRRYQVAPVINYPNDHEYTRITEFKYLTGQSHSKTSIVKEFPRAEGDPYYPIPRPETNELYLRYKMLASAERNVHFVGRLANYRYFNMDQVVAQALATFSKLSMVRAQTVSAIEIKPADELTA